MTSVKLTEDQQKIREEIIEHLKRLKDWQKLSDTERKQRFEKMSQLAHELHMQLEPKPKHHRHMIENRGMAPEHPLFYRHIHPVEDLLDYLDDIHANDDPEDQTIGHEFLMSIYSRKNRGHVRIELKRIEDGWRVEMLSHSEKCDKAASKYLYEVLDNEGINYPEELPGYLEWLWNQAHEEGLSHEEVERAVNELSDWITVCERNSPSGIFRGFK